jgi:hypothetical protein
MSSSWKTTVSGGQERMTVKFLSLYRFDAEWVWALVLWQLLQIAMLYAQERFGPAFL